MKNKLLPIMISVLMSASLFASDSCEEIRGSFDIGSGSTKMKVYKYNTCTNSIIKKIKKVNGIKCSGKVKVSYKEHMNKEIRFIQIKDILEGIDAINKLKKIAISCGATKFAGVATSAFRLARNGDTVVKDLKKFTKINIYKISQEKEAQLGFNGVVGKYKVSRSNICVWDIGGSSMQIVCTDQDGNFVKPYLGKFASVSIRNAVMDFQNKSIFSFINSDHKNSPNPVGTIDFIYATDVMNKIAEEVSSVISKKLLENNTFYGIGGVHKYGVYKAIHKRVYSANDILDFITNNLYKTDTDLGGGKFASYTVTNPIFVESLMRDLNIKTVESLDVNLTEGLVSDSKFWE